MLIISYCEPVIIRKKLFSATLSGNKDFTMQRTIYLILIACLIIVVTNQQVEAQQSAPIPAGFALAREMGSQKVEISIIAPDRSTKVLKRLEVPMPDGYREHTLVYAKASPNGKWIVLAYDDIRGRRVQLVNVKTGQSQFITNIGRISSYDYSDSEDRHFPVWSPDNKFLAFINSPFAYSTPAPTPGSYGRLDDRMTLQATETPFSTFGMYLYSIESNTLIPFALNPSPRNFFWSGKGGLFILERGIAPNAGTLEVYGNYAKSHTLREYTLSSACQGTWSDNLRYFAYVSRCVDLETLVRDVFVYDIYQMDIERTHQIRQITMNTNLISGNELLGPLYDYSTRYSLLWLGNRLVIGTASYHFIYEEEGKSRASDSIVARLQLYNPVTTETYTLLSEAADALTYGYGEVALRAASMLPDTENGARFENSRTLLIKIDGHDLNITGTFESGCNYQWSPKSAILAYEACSPQIGDTYKPYELRKIVFVDRATNDVVSYSAEDRQSRIAGWVVLN